MVAGNIHDSQSFHQLYDKLDLNDTKIVALDAGFKTPSVMRKIFMSGCLPAVPYTRPKTKDGFFRKSNYVYDEYFDCYLCPQNQILKSRHLWSDFLEEADHLRHITLIRDTYKKRKETIERVFADAKERHCLRYTNYREHPLN